MYNISDIKVKILEYNKNGYFTTEGSAKRIPMSEEHIKEFEHLEELNKEMEALIEIANKSHGYSW